MVEHTDKLCVAFTGDIAFTHHMQKMADKGEPLSEDILRWLKECQHCVCNIEGAFFDGEFTEDRLLLHRSSPEYLRFIRQLHGDVWNLANNHMLDCGKDGLLSTLHYAEQEQVKFIGAGMDIQEASATVSLGDDLVGLLSVGTSRYCERAGKDKPGCFLWDEDALISERIREVKSRCRWCVVVAHAGEEFSDMPFPEVREKYLRFLEMGADIVVGHHPHVVQNYEQVGEKIIFYSIGNFMFDTDYQRHQPRTDVGILLRITFDRDAYSWEDLPFRIDRQNDRIVPAERPVIFSNIGAKEYARLWPVAASVFIKRTEKRLCYVQPKLFQGWTPLKWKITHLKRFRLPEGRAALLGALKKPLTAKADRPEILGYLNDNLSK